MTAPPTMRLTKAVMLRTRRVSKKVNRFLFVGRMEKNVLQRAMQQKLETTIAIAQVAQLKIILGRLLSTDSKEAGISFPRPLSGAVLCWYSGVL